MGYFELMTSDVAPQVKRERLQYLRDRDFAQVEETAADKVYRDLFGISLHEAMMEHLREPKSIKISRQAGAEEV